MRAAATVALSLAAVALAGCTCSAVGVESGLRVQVDAAPGLYSIVVIAEGEELSTDFELRADGLTCPEACVVTGAQVMLDVRRSFLDVDGFVARVAHTLGQDGPSEVAVEIYRDGALVHEGTIQAVYTPQYPNGESCGAAGDTADARIALATGG